jgi:hypothetical protein
VDDITLPPLPPAEWLGYDDPERGDFHGHSFDEMREFARAAVLLDRQQRATVECPMCCAEVVRVAGAYDTPAPSAEPVAWITVEEDGLRHGLREWRDGTHREVPLYTTAPDHLAVMQQALDALKVVQTTVNNYGNSTEIGELLNAIVRAAAALAKEAK